MSVAKLQLLQTQDIIHVRTQSYGTPRMDLDPSLAFTRGWLGGPPPFLPYFLLKFIFLMLMKFYLYQYSCQYIHVQLELVGSSIKRGKMGVVMQSGLRLKCPMKDRGTMPKFKRELWSIVSTIKVYCPTSQMQRLSLIQIIFPFLECSQDVEHLRLPC